MKMFRSHRCEVYSHMFLALLIIFYNFKLEVIIN